MKKVFVVFAFIIATYCFGFSQNSPCNQASQFCTETIYNFPAPVNTGTAETGPNYGCLNVQNNPVWFYLLIDQPGDIFLDIHTVPSRDVDYICWGPFTSQITPCTSELTSSNIISCSFDASYQEWCNIPNALSGQYYILLVTKYDSIPANIIIKQNTSIYPNPGSTNCTSSVLFNNLNEESFSVYPNPVVNSIFTINYSSYLIDKISIKIINTQGIEVFRKLISKNMESIEIQIDSSGLINGYYLVEINDGQKIIRKSIIVQNKF